MQTRTLEELNAWRERDQVGGDYTGYVVAKAVVAKSGHGRILDAEYRRLRPHSKAAIDATGGGDAPSLLAQGPRAYAALVRPRGPFGGRIPGARPLPARTRYNALAAGGTAAFVTEKDSIPVTPMDVTARSAVDPGVIAAIVVVTRELAEHSDPAAFNAIQSDLSSVVVDGQWWHLFDGLDAVAEGRPKSILFGVSPLGSGSPTNIEDDVAAIVSAVRAGKAVSPVFICSLTGALYLAGLRTSGGQRVFPDVTLLGGSIIGAPLVIASAAQDKLIFLDGTALFFHDGPVELDVSRSAALQLNDQPTAEAANVVAMWQTNSLAIRVQQVVGWAMAVPDGVSYCELPLGSPVV